jgi:hypothetical protein
MNVRRLATSLCLAASVFALPVGSAFAATAEPAAAAAEAPDVQPAALDALNRMSAYLRTLQTFQVSGETMREEINDNGQKLQFLGSTTYKVRRPDGFSIEIAEDRRVRKVFYDGKSLTLFAPRMNYYSTVAAPATIHEVLDVAAAKYGITVPLEDLFVWGTSEDWHNDLKVGYWVGYAHLAGQDADQYAFREDGVDWQIWIARGDKPLPLRVVITGTDEPSQPQFEATLNWDTAPQFAPDAFVFTPPADAKAIVLNTASK